MIFITFFSIYIPIWFYLYNDTTTTLVCYDNNLHSNMVLLIFPPISNDCTKYSNLHSNMVLLILSNVALIISPVFNLHSNMVLLIFKAYISNIYWKNKFTFQYGSTYILLFMFLVIMVKLIYIPIWFYLYKKI